MNEELKAEISDTLLHHNREDKAAVREIAWKLARNRLRRWLVEKQIRPGTSRNEASAQQIESITTAVVFVAESGLGPLRHPRK